ncbi:MAG TPA: nucleotidyltransferase family protein [Anaerolineales bacterium]|nr:nucleotidyltransferase family protein [Anaerolineales bacterium]
MKALILAGGRGSRLKELTESINKCMHPFKGRPLIEYSLHNAVSASAEEIIIVVSYQAESIINYFGNRYGNTPIKYVIQWERKGLVHAIEYCKDTLDGADFMLFLADEMLFNPQHGEMMRCFSEQNVFSLCGAVQVEDKTQISKTYAIIFDEQSHQIFRLIEKPRKPLNDWMGTGNCVFKNQIFDYIPYTPINQNRNEKELPDLIQCAIDDGRLVKFFDIGGDYVNINTIEDVTKLQENQ